MVQGFFLAVGRMVKGGEKKRVAGSKQSVGLDSHPKGPVPVPSAHSVYSSVPVCRLDRQGYDSLQLLHATRLLSSLLLL